MKCNEHGFSLIEILTAISILVILIAVSIPNFRNYQASLNFNDTSRALVGNLRYTQQLAITEQKMYGVIINEPANRYYVVWYDPDTKATTTVKTVILPSNIQFQPVTDFNCNFIRYTSYGSVHESGSIVLVNNNGDTQTIQIKPSGYVEL